jgi:hypothetical protein
MKAFVTALILTTLASVPSLAQSTASGAQNDSTAANQSAKPKGGTTLIGCLSGPDPDGKYTLRSMEHRIGVEVFGSDKLKVDSGGKVQLTGSWKPAEQSADQTAKAGSAKKHGKFEATEVELLAEACQAPTEKTPVSKKKQQQEQLKQEQQKQKSATSTSTSADTSAPKP